MTVQELYESVGGSYESVKRILPMDRLITKFVLKFLSDTSCQRLVSARENGDNAGIFEAAHSMKGVCANLGLNSLSEQASVIAEEFRGGKDPSMDQAELDRRIEQLKGDYERTIEGIQKFAAEQ